MRNNLNIQINIEAEALKKARNRRNKLEKELMENMTRSQRVMYQKIRDLREEESLTTLNILMIHREAKVERDELMIG